MDETLPPSYIPESELDTHYSAADFLKWGEDALRHGDAREAADCFAQALSLACSTKDEEAMGWAYIGLGAAYYALGDVHTAINCYENAYDECTGLDSRAEAKLACNLGDCYIRLHKVRVASKYYEDAYQRSSDPAVERWARAGLDDVKALFGRDERVVPTPEGQLSIVGGAGDVLAEANALLHVGSNDDLELVWDALYLYRQYLDYGYELGDQEAKADAFEGLAHSSIELGRVRHAVDFYERSLNIARELADRDREARLLRRLGSAYYMVGKDEQALACHQQRIDIARTIGDRRGETAASWALGRLHVMMGDLAKAIPLMQVFVDYERELGHADADEHAAVIDDLREPQRYPYQWR